MTDHGQGAEQFEDASEPVEETTEDDLVAEEKPSEFSGGEGTVALAGIILVVVWLIFDVIADQYSLATVAIVLGAAAAILPRINRDSVAKVMPLAVAMKVIGYALLLVGIVEIVTDIETDSYDSLMGVIGALAAYAAYAFAVVGARSIET